MTIQYKVYDIDECGIEEPMTEDLEEFDGETHNSESNELAARDWITVNSDDWDDSAAGALLVVSEGGCRFVYNFDYKVEINLYKVEE